MPPAATDPAAFAPIQRSERLADRVAGALTDSIVSGRLQPGDRLPPERELCEQFAVSRPVVREAVRSLIAKGLLEDSPRRGHVVSALRQENVTESLALYLRGQRLDYRKLMEVRSVIEVAIAGLAAERASPPQVLMLRAAAAELTTELAPEEAALADTEFHRQIATATGNEFFELLLDSIRETLLTVQLPTLAEPKILRAARRAHARIVDAIAGGDPEQAREAMRQHLREAERGMRSVLTSDPDSARLG